MPRNWPIRAFTEVFAIAIEMPWTDGKPYITGPRREPRRSLDGMPTMRPERDKRFPESRLAPVSEWAVEVVVRPPLAALADNRVARV